MARNGWQWEAKGSPQQLGQNPLIEMELDQLVEGLERFVCNGGGGGSGLTVPRSTFLSFLLLSYNPWGGGFVLHPPLQHHAPHVTIAGCTCRLQASCNSCMAVPAPMQASSLRAASRCPPAGPGQGPRYPAGAKSSAASAAACCKHLRGQDGVSVPPGMSCPAKGVKPATRDPNEAPV